MSTFVQQRPNDVHQVWDSFDREMRKQLEQDDATAWRGVTGILLAVVIGGVMLGFLGVVMSLNF